MSELDRLADRTRLNDLPKIDAGGTNDLPTPIASHDLRQLKIACSVAIDHPSLGVRNRQLVNATPIFWVHEGHPRCRKVEVRPRSRNIG